MQTAVLELQKKGLFVFAADMNGQALWNTNLTMPCALVIGSEGNGVSKLVRDTVDGIISIPQKGKINSLNASNAAAVLLCEVCRQRG
jgi:23S rRNA (guanosine2251-2'-O)-methyltransferase